MSKDKILFCEKEEICFIKLIGDLRYNLSPGFDNMVKKELCNNAILQFILDLRETEYLDSTNLGILGMIAAGAQAAHHKKPIICGPNKDILTILRSMGFDSLFKMEEAWNHGDITYQDVAEIEVNKKESRVMILETHQALAEMNSYNKEKFAPVIDAILKKKGSG